MACRLLRSISVAMILLLSTTSFSTFGAAEENTSTSAVLPEAKPVQPNLHHLVESFTAYMLAPGETKVGFDLEHGFFERFSLGTDLLATAIGAPSLQGKLLVWHDNPHAVAFLLHATYLSRETALWGSVRDHFDELDARILRPGIAWTNEVSPRLSIHTAWSVGYGKTTARLSEKGKRHLWESKHPNGDYDSRNVDANGTSDSGNQAKSSTSTSFAQRTLQVGSITGMLTDLFQITGDFNRLGGDKIILTSRIERTAIEDLKSNGFRLTAAHQWIWDSFQMRLGIGLQYTVISGRDLDGEKIDEAGILPASDVAFYWRF